MKKRTLLISLVLLAAMVFLITTSVLAEPVRAGVLSVVAAAENVAGPAPNSGDCVPDGSGFDQPNGPNADSTGKGPAPNSGDGIPDGSGF